MNPAPFTVIIPAHNEANVIGRCLEKIYQGAPRSDAVQVIVAANGCSDDTAKTVRTCEPRATVIELAEGSKTKAMNAGRTAASHFPQVFLDADICCDFQSLRALVDALLDRSAMAAMPLARFELSQASASVQAYYRVWLEQPYASQALGGSGCFALSQEALKRIGPFPEIIGDDLWAMSRFTDQERILVSESTTGQPVFSCVTPPKTMIEQIRVEARRRIGTEQIKRNFPIPALQNTPNTSLLRSTAANGPSQLDTLCFLAVKSASKVLAEWRKLLGQDTHWVRDNSSRQL